MFKDKFIKLVEENDGFEFYQAFSGDVDKVFGGKGNTYWHYVLKNGKVTELYVGKKTGDVWEDTYQKGTKTKALAPGSTIELIAKCAYLAQDEKWVKDRTGKLIEDAHPHLHYVYGFGDKAADVSKEYGVTVGYSDLKDSAAGFRLRYLYTGSEVELP